MFEQTSRKYLAPRQREILQYAMAGKSNSSNLFSRATTRFFAMRRNPCGVTYVIASRAKIVNSNQGHGQLIR